MYYLYNGVKLPNIYTVYTPEIQKTHPFAYIYRGDFDNNGSWDGFYLDVFSSYDYRKTSSGEHALYHATENTLGWKIVADENGLPKTDVWIETAGIGAYVVPSEGMWEFWSNFDMLNEDGSVFLAASDPVPVSPVQIDPALLVQSFFTGQAVRRSRK